MVTVNKRQKNDLTLEGFDFDAWLDHLRVNRPERELIKLQQVYSIMEGVVEHQRHLFGESELHRTLMVAEILADLHMDSDTLLACLIHGLVMVDALSLDEVKSNYSESLYELVAGVDKMRIVDAYNLHLTEAAHDKNQMESVRKLLLALAEDIRVVIIKLAERLHIMRNLKLVAEPVRVQLARETMDIFAPLASRLGIWQVKWELEDSSFRYLEPGDYQKVAKMLDERRIDREQYITQVTHTIKQELNKAGINAQVTGRPKHIYSIWRKMQRKGVGFQELFDVRATRILVNTVADCYGVLGIVHNLWRPIKSEFDDYIASPKENNYQSLHTAVIGPDNKTIEIQIRTHDMHQHCEYGVAAHWGYKEGGKQDSRYTEKIAWLRQILEFKDDGGDSGDFIDHFKSEVFADRVYVLTPQGKVVDLPKGATALDFAYSIHTEVGHHYCGAKANGKIIPIAYELQSGQTVEVLTSKHSAPSRDWLNPHLGYIKSPRTRSKVRGWFKQLDYAKNVEDGRNLLEREMHRLGLDNPNYEKLLKRYNQPKVDDLYAALGRGEITTEKIASALQDQILKSSELTKPKIERLGDAARKAASGLIDGVQIMGVGDLMTKLARCCKPLPYDEITGYITRGTGVTIHRNDCANLLRLRATEKERLIEVAWGHSAKDIYPVDIYVRAFDRPGLLKDITNTIYNSELNVVKVNTYTDKKSHIATMTFSLEVNDIAQLSQTLAKIEQLPNILEVARKHTS
ncbi:GTP diphosphokinase [Kaarinaea lacus]